jgi:hypothetical protein
MMLAMSRWGIKMLIHKFDIKTDELRVGVQQLIKR